MGQSVNWLVVGWGSAAAALSVSEALMGILPLTGSGELRPSQGWW